MHPSLTPVNNHPTPPLQDDMSFEQALEQLQAIVARLEEGRLTLDESIASFQQGAELAVRCQRLIATAELKISTLAEPGATARDEPSGTERPTLPGIS